MSSNFFSGSWTRCRSEGANVRDFAVPAVILRGALFNRPVVYAWCRDGEVLYVGSGCSIGRPLNARHHRMRSGVLPQDDLLVWTQPSLRAARLLECRLIRELEPTLNVVRRRPALYLKKRGA